MKATVQIFAGLVCLSVTALFAYNAGEGKANQWRSFHTQYADTLHISVYRPTYGDKAIVTFRGDTVLTVHPLTDSIAVLERFSTNMEKWLKHPILKYYTFGYRPEWIDCDTIYFKSEGNGYGN